MENEPKLRVLVAYGSERGSTAEIAHAITETLLNERFEVEIRDAHDVQDVDKYDAVVVGGALYMGHWHRDARRFVKRHAAALRGRIVYMFSSGPLDDSATLRDIPPTSSVKRLAELVGARAHVTFGGELARDAKGFIASNMAKKLSGDWRAWHKIRAWAVEIAEAMKTAPARSVPIVAQSIAGRWLLAAMCFFVGITAVGGGATLIARPDGSLLEMPQALLARSPFDSFLIPGMLLCFVLGVGSIVAAALVARDKRIANHVAFAAGAALLVWIVAEMAMLRSMRLLQLSYFAVAVLIMVEAVSRAMPRRSAQIRFAH